jgi:hypothetical protein
MATSSDTPWKLNPPTSQSNIAAVSRRSMATQMSSARISSTRLAEPARRTPGRSAPPRNRGQARLLWGRLLFVVKLRADLKPRLLSWNSNQRHQLALGIGITVDVTLGGLNRTMTGQQLNISQLGTGIVD